MKSFWIVCPLICCMLFACKREKVEVIGPELGIASPNFKLSGNLFSAEYPNVDFTLDSNWFNAEFNERVSWELVIRGTQSKAVKCFKGTSTEISRANTNWTGGHSDLYFFKAGEQVVAELSIFGLHDKWYDTVNVVKAKANWGSDVLLWWDMDNNGAARNGFPYVYWFDFYDTNERLADFMVADISNDPVQGIYRTIEGKDGLGPSNYFIGGASHSPSATPLGFNDDLSNIYLNFYIRRRTTTTNLGVQLTSIATGDTSQIVYTVGILDSDGWRKVSAPLSEFVLTAGDPAFNPAAIRQFAVNPYIANAPGQDQSGFDIDFIVLTNGAPFNPDRY